MTELLTLLCSAIAAESRDDKVALLLSGGLDSVSVGIALQKIGKPVHGYTYHLQGYPSRDLNKAIAIARHFRWPLTIVTVPTTDMAADFVRLAVEHRCRTKVQFEVTFPLLYVIAQIQESEIWTGWNADDHYGNEKNSILGQRRMARQNASSVERKAAFDEERRRLFEHDLTNPDSGDTWWFAHRIAVQHGKLILDPYLDSHVREYFLRFNHDQLSPVTKPLVRQALAEELRDLPDGSLAFGVRLQIGGGVDTLFETLLQNEAINRFEKRYRAVSGLCQRWGREVSRHPDSFLAELNALPPQSAAITSSNDSRDYRPYLMGDVRRESSRERYTVISMFAGGGGSSIGHGLAGGHVVSANEFVPEAARTYRINFPGTPVDDRDIREIVATTTQVETVLAQAGLRPGELDMLDGSPPCAEFSSLGGGISDQSELRTYSDVRQRGMATLIFDLFRLAAFARPKIVITENVPQLAFRHRDLFEHVLNALRLRDTPHFPQYYVNWAVLTASDFGVPQRRRRLFLIGVRTDVAEAVGISSDNDVARLFPQPNCVPVSIRSALAGLQQRDEDIDPWRRAAMTCSVGSIIRRLPRNSPQLVRPRHVGLAEGTRFSLVRCAWELPAPTLTAAGQAPDGLSGAIHPEADRKFTLPELKRLFGLPDDYMLTGTVKQAAERICRMVPPLVTKAIAERVYELVLRPYAERLP